MKKFLAIIGVMTALLMSCSKNGASYEEMEPPFRRDTTVTVTITYPALSQKLKVKEVIETTWVGEEVAETSYEVYLDVIQGGKDYKKFLGTVKKTAQNFIWTAPEYINGIAINSDCCYLTFVGVKNSSYIIGPIFSIRP